MYVQQNLPKAVTLQLELKAHFLLTEKFKSHATEITVLNLQ